LDAVKRRILQTRGKKGVAAGENENHISTPFCLNAFDGNALNRFIKLFLTRRPSFSHCSALCCGGTYAQLSSRA
jgi:hypothetical protein